ncbi:poly(A) polymerase [Desulfurivibrio sp. D14AmB]|uniref:poly(A) polymerase n=1 Tax=Desulfurivibrio sp. D14AmB TaxID=3374370 RepID=UPI00376EDFB2
MSQLDDSAALREEAEAMTATMSPQPRVIPRAEHTVSRADIDREALKVMHRLRDEGHLAYLVGGGVRDLLLGKKPKDFDISTSAKPGELRKIFRNSRIIGRRFRLVQVFFPGGKIIEVATFRCRSEFEANGGEIETLAHDNTFGTPVEDAFRRDLTINALFYEIENFTVIDYTGGVEDLRNRLVRLVGDPDRRLLRDPVRMLRAIRHAARSDFTIENETWLAICRHVDKLGLCPDSRLRDELFKDLRAGASRSWADFALASGIFFELFPFYRGILPPPGPADQESQRLIAPAPLVTLLFKLLRMVDQMVAAGKEFSEEMLLALLLLPWAEARFELLAKELDRSGAYRFSRKLRSELDEILVPLNIKRSSKESLAMLLSNLPLLLAHCPVESEEEVGEWPKPLARKGYFPQCLALYELYRAALTGEQPSAIISAAAPPPPAVKRKSARPGRRREGRAPAFVKGGIFGLKK